MIKYLEYIISRPRITTSLIIIANSSIGVIGYYIYNLNIEQIIILCILSVSTTFISYVKGVKAGRLFSSLEFKKDVVEYRRNRNFKKEDDIDLENELFIKGHIILITMEKFTQQKVFQLLKQTTFFESERLQKFIFGNNKQTVDYYKQLMKQYNINNF